MKVVNVIWMCVVICFGGVISCFAQQGTKNQVLLERIARIYAIIPQDLKADELLEKIDEVDKQVNLLIDSISNQELKSKAQLLRFN